MILLNSIYFLYICQLITYILNIASIASINEWSFSRVRLEVEEVKSKTKDEEDVSLLHKHIYSI